MTCSTLGAALVFFGLVVTGLGVSSKVISVLLARAGRSATWSSNSELKSPLEAVFVWQGRSYWATNVRFVGTEKEGKPWFAKEGARLAALERFAMLEKEWKPLPQISLDVLGTTLKLFACDWVARKEYDSILDLLLSRTEFMSCCL